MQHILSYIKYPVESDYSYCQTMEVVPPNMYTALLVFFLVNLHANKNSHSPSNTFCLQFIQSNLLTSILFKYLFILRQMVESHFRTPV